MIESRFPSITSVDNRPEYVSVSVTVIGKPSWTDSVISDMLDSAAFRQEPRITHVDVAAGHEDERIKSKKDDDGEYTETSTGRVLWSRTYFYHPNPPPPSKEAEKSDAAPENPSVPDASKGKK